MISMIPSVRYSSGGYIEIKTPENFILPSSGVSCTAITGFSGSSGTCSRIDENTIRYTRNIV